MTHSLVYHLKLHIAFGSTFFFFCHVTSMLVNAGDAGVWKSFPWYKTAAKGMASNPFLAHTPMGSPLKRGAASNSPLLGGERCRTVISALGTINFSDNNAYETGFVCVLFPLNARTKFLLPSRMTWSGSLSLALQNCFSQHWSSVPSSVLSSITEVIVVHITKLKQNITASKTAVEIYLCRYIFGTVSTYEYLATPVKKINAIWASKNSRITVSASHIINVNQTISKLHRISKADDQKLQFCYRGEASPFFRVGRMQACREGFGSPQPLYIYIFFFFWETLKILPIL